MAERRMQISKEQQDIIDSKDDMIVVSNPGTGKTTTLSLKVIKLLEDGIKPEKILCITFTVKAKKEMFEAIRKNAGERFSDEQITGINIHTFHSFAYNYLLDAGLIPENIVGNNLMRFSILNSFEKTKALNYGKDYTIYTMIPKTENALRYIKSFGITPDMIDTDSAISILEEIFGEGTTGYTIREMKAFLKYMVEAYKEYEKSKYGAVDYADMLLLFREKFGGKKFEHVLVDEMQDMNEIESEIAVIVAENLFLVGDAKQAIFGFQGGSVKNFEKFAEKFETKMLSMNRRSSQQILDYSKRHFLNGTQNRKLYEKELTGFSSEKAGTVPTVISTKAHLSRILDVIKENPDSKIGIITRRNDQLIGISKFLDSNGIKYSSTSSQATTKQAREEIQRYVKGLLSDRIEDKISAAFTVFSPYSLKEAFGFSKALKDKDSEKLAKLRSWGTGLQRSDLDSVFAGTVMPICISKEREWFTSAVTIKKEIDEYLAFENPTQSGLVDFIVISQESYDEQRTESKVMLTTVHKAKGREFDTVVYLPTGIKKAGFIDHITDSILRSNKIQTESELTEESLRVDFVAFTRARNSLIIMAEDSISKKYHIEGFSEMIMDDTQDESVKVRQPYRLTEAYSLFVAGRISESSTLLEEKETWLLQYIRDYFANIEHLSYSRIERDPYKFLKNNIISLPYYNERMEFGSSVHGALQRILTGKTSIGDYVGDVARAAKNGLDAIERLKKEYPGLQVESVERHVSVPINSMVNGYVKDLEFAGVFDVVFKHDEGYLIIDYKTDKKSTRSSDHKRQLAAYKRMLSISDGIPEGQISTCVVFVSLQDNINTGRFDMETSKGTRDVYSTFEGHLGMVLGWRDDPGTFINDFLEKDNDEPLYHAVREKLQAELAKKSA